MRFERHVKNEIFRREQDLAKKRSCVLVLHFANQEKYRPAIQKILMPAAFPMAHLKRYAPSNI